MPIFVILFQIFMYKKDQKIQKIKSMRKRFSLYMKGTSTDVPAFAPELHASVRVVMLFFINTNVWH